MELHPLVTLLLAIGIAAGLFSLATLAWGCALAWRRHRAAASTLRARRASVSTAPIGSQLDA